MSIESLKNNWPGFAKDIKLNLPQVLSEDGAPGLSEKQRYGVALSVAYALNHQVLVDAIREDSAELLTAEDINAIKSAVSIMAMNNIYYRFVHLANDAELNTLPAKLRMMVIGKPGVDKLDFEAYCLAVSAINGCGMCIESHTKQLTNAGMSKLGIQSVGRIAAVIHAAGASLDLQQIEDLQSA
jgi:alkyl hydroperoxide reductase subunit D